jgi:isoquinoline 1-oxidoreductase beta subunit
MTEKTQQSPNQVDTQAEPTKHAEKTLIDRRDFLATSAAVVGSTAVFGFWLPGKAEAAAAAAGVVEGEVVRVAPTPWYRQAMVPEVNAWIAIAPDDTVTIRIGQTELGTGVLTCNSMIVAEELQCDWKKVRAEYADANRDYKEKAPEWTLKVPGKGVDDPASAAPTALLEEYDGVYRRMAINSSGNVREGRYYLQLAGAEARERLLLAASNEWGVPVTELVAKDSVITHAKSKRRITYGAIAGKAAHTQLPDPSKVKMKTPDQYTLLGTEQKNFDIPLKVTGQAIYGIDIRMPGMLYATVTSCPVWGGDLKSYNADAVKNMPGVHAVVPLALNAKTRSVGFLSGGVGVVADTWWHAKKALDALPIEWDYGPNRNVSSATLYDAHVAAAKARGAVVTNEGNVEDGFSKAAKIIEATYDVPYSPRARMEPGDATVLVTDNRLDAWTGDQNPQQFLRYASRLTGIAPENVYVHTTFQGGGYGNGGNGDQGEKAVAVANAMRGRPVKMLWTREEDWARGTKYRPMSVCLMKAGLDANGWPIAMEVRHATTWTGDMGFRALHACPYFMPNYRLTMHYPKSHVPFGTRRATGAAPNAFYMECFIDELAAAAGQDPYKYRRELIARNPPKPRLGLGGFHRRDDWLTAIDMVAKQSNWGSPLPAGWGRGIAIDDRRRPTRATQTICAQVHVIEVSKEGQVKFHRADIVFEQGFAFMHPVAVHKQLEGQMNWGYDDTMYQGTTIKDGAAVEDNFDKFQVSRMNEYPKEVNISFFKTNRWITGAGEEGITQVPPAICNAIFKATGKRHRSIPLKNQDLSWG